MRNTEEPKDLTVAISRDKSIYSSDAPYDPSESYPEYPFDPGHVSGVDNPAYRTVRNNFILLKMDPEQIGLPSWNPLRDIVRPGSKVVIKPNFVIDRHYGGGDLYSIVTHPSVIRAVADFCLIAMRGKGELIIADAPVEDCDFGNLIEIMRLREVQSAYQSRADFDLQVRDLRQYTTLPGDRVYKSRRTQLPGDPDGNVIVDLGETSALAGKQGPFFGSDPDTEETNANHHGSTHRYCISGTVLSCDSLISIPKLKVHKKVGVTLNLKNMVGINTNKNYLVHYTLGTPRSGGDQTVDPKKAADTTILRMRRLISDTFVKSHNPVLERIHKVFFHSRPYLVFRGMLRRLGVEQSAAAAGADGGNWYGNDTCWRMVADLARIFSYADKDGVLHTAPQRTLFSIVDGIMGGDTNGPLRPRTRREGVVVSGVSPLAVDIACVRLMGFDPNRLPLFTSLMGFQGLLHLTSEADIAITTADPELAQCISSPGEYLAFAPHLNWAGHIETDTGKSRAGQ
ncbi:MAG: DUF362 domain-containing protein [Phycisphaeraceae bacterium]|nr:DUF362 domain-containing protein [Phycisphaeraceae bacterium]